VKTAFVLGGGGLLGAHEVGMLRALAEADWITENRPVPESVVPAP
jgi:predicted acylesterase/phospholipase RssA